MTITIHVDGYPYLIEFTGSIEVVRLWDDNVAVRLTSSNATAKVSFDEDEHRAIERFNARMQGLIGWGIDRDFR